MRLSVIPSHGACAHVVSSLLILALAERLQGLETAGRACLLGALIASKERPLSLQDLIVGLLMAGSLVRGKLLVQATTQHIVIIIVIII